MTYKGQGRLERFLEFVGLIKTGEWVWMPMGDDSAVKTHNQMVRDDG